MKTSSLETVLGALVLIIAAVFLIYSASVGEVKKVEGYAINARFNQVGSLQAGDDVRISGVKIGTVKAITLTKNDYLANVEATIDNSVKLPADSAATIASSGLLGGNYLDISPGGDELMLDNNGIIQYTQDAQNLERLLGQFIFSVQGAKDKGGETSSDSDTPPADTSMPEMPADDSAASASESEKTETAAPPAEEAPVAVPDTAPAVETSAPAPAEPAPAAPESSPEL